MANKILHEDGTVILTENGEDLLNEESSSPGKVLHEDGTGMLTEDAIASGSIVVLRRRIMEVA